MEKFQAVTEIPDPFDKGLSYKLGFVAVSTSSDNIPIDEKICEFKKRDPDIAALLVHAQNEGTYTLFSAKKTEPYVHERIAEYLLSKQWFRRFRISDLNKRKEFVGDDFGYYRSLFIQLPEKGV